MIHEFASVFSTNLLYVGLPRKAFPGKQAKVDTTLRLHTSVFLWLHKQEPRFAQGQPNGYFQMKELDRTTEPIARMNVEWKLEKAEFAEFNLPTFFPHCSLTAVQRRTAFAEESWWPEFHMFGSMPLCSFPWHTLLPRLMQNNCCTVYSLNLIHEFTSLFRRSEFCRFAKESLPTEIGKGRHSLACSILTTERFKASRELWLEPGPSRNFLFRTSLNFNMSRRRNISAPCGSSTEIAPHCMSWMMSALEATPPLTSVFFCGCTSSSQDSPKASPMAIFKWKNLIGQLNPLPIARMNVEWKLEKAECQHVANPTCAITC